MSAASRAALDRDMRDERMKECAGEMFKALKLFLDEHDNTYDGEPMTMEMAEFIERAREVVFKVERPV